MISLDQAWLSANPLPCPDAETDKNKRGRVLVAGGAETVPGALLLTGEAAFRAGAGKVQLATVVRAAITLGLQMPEAAVFGLPANGAGELAGEAGRELADMLEMCDIAVLGPGMGDKADASQILREMLSGAASRPALLLDSVLIGAVADLAEEVRAWDGPVVLTPHAGEMAALMACDENDISPALAEEAAGRFGVTVVLKTSRTWIASPNTPTLHYDGGGPGLATGGSGDVLAGIIAGLLARGADPRTATGWGVWLHGAAGRLLAQRVGPLGFMAHELLPELPKLMADPSARQTVIDRARR